MALVGIVVLVTTAPVAVRLHETCPGPRRGTFGEGRRRVSSFRPLDRFRREIVGTTSSDEKKEGE
jgi:hypothetical protein